jgi:homoserine kinase type II
VTDYSTILNAWGVVFAETDCRAEIEGSPERAAMRAVVRDTSGRRWILEKITPENLERKKRIAEQLQALSGLSQIHPYCQTTDASFFYDHWMLRPYVDGVPLDRKTYLNDSWRIDAMTQFLIQLRKHSAGQTGARFSIASYAEGRMVAWRKTNPQRADQLEGSLTQLKQRFFPVHDSLPVAFCHGDYHPLNMVWGTGYIRSVIDWEFCGIKPELYDVALLVGCIGFENPDHLIRDPVIRLVRTLRAAGFGTPESWIYFLELAATIRFGWMSEWIRRRDREAQKMEAVYIDILVDQAEYIQQHWQL